MAVRHALFCTLFFLPTYAMAETFEPRTVAPPPEYAAMLESDGWKPLSAVPDELSAQAKVAEDYVFAYDGGDVRKVESLSYKSFEVDGEMLEGRASVGGAILPGVDHGYIGLFRSGHADTPSYYPNSYQDGDVEFMFVIDCRSSEDFPCGEGLGLLVSGESPYKVKGTWD